MPEVENTIIRFTEEIWDAVLGKGALHRVQSKNWTEEEKVLMTVIEFSGAWKGAVVLQCSDFLARKAAATIFRSDPRDIEPEMIRDAIGELVNMAAGNLKPVLPSPCQLSLPIHAGQAQYTAGKNGWRHLSEVDFEWHGHPFCVTLLEKGEVHDRLF